MPVKFDFFGAIKEMERLSKPKKVYVVTDASIPTRARRLEKFKEALAQMEVSFETEFLVDWSMEDLKRKLSTLPPESTIFYALILQDGTGKKYIPYNALEELAEHANAPIYSHWDTLMGSGMLGGYLLSGERVGQAAAQAIGMLMTGADGETAPIEAHGYYYDWRQMKRWGIGQKQLPEGAVVHYYEPGVFEKYRWQIVLILIVLLLLISLSAGLLVVNRKRQHALQALNREHALLEQRVLERTESLHKSEEFLNETGRVAKVGGWEFDIASNAVRWTSETYRIHELPEDYVPRLEEAIDFYHPDDRDKLIQAVQAATEQGTPYDLELRFTTAKGTQLWIRTICMPQTVDGNTIKLKGTFQDITELKRMRDILIQSEKMMSVGGLAAGMAHELNNPLGGILLGLQNIRRRLSPDLESNRKTAGDLDLDLRALSTYLDRRGISDFMQNIGEAGERAAAIVRNMLDFARKPESKLKEERLDVLTDNALKLALVDYDLKKKYDFREIEIIKEYGSEPLHVMCIASEIQQVLLNLFANAGQAFHSNEMPGERSPRITIRTYTQHDPACLEIDDNGPGMDQQVRDHIFDPFFTTRPPGEGTGLGLSISYFIITQEHGGEINVESEPGKGTRFQIKLPLARRPHP